MNGIQLIGTDLLVPYEHEFALSDVPDEFPDTITPPSHAITRFFEPNRLRLYEDLYCTKLGNKSLSVLGATMQLFLPVSAIFAGDGRWYLRCKHKDTELNHLEIFLAERRPLERTKDLFCEFELSQKGSHSFFSFLNCFAGMREQLPPSSGSYAYDEFTLFCDHPASDGVDFSDEHAEWEDALCFFFASNGDKLLVTEDGLTGWFFHEEFRIDLYTETFDEFVKCYASFLKDIGGPFDAYSAYEIF